MSLESDGITMNEQQHPFEKIWIWSELPDDEIIAILDEKEAKVALGSAIELLMDNQIELSTYPTEDYPNIVKKLQMLIRQGSWNLGESIIKADDFTKSGDSGKAIAEMKRFISSCNSPFYRRSAEAHLSAIKRKF